MSTGRTALVTGGTDGIGREIALGLARAGHSVILVGRDADKGARAERELRAATGNADVVFLQCDLSRMREANLLADEIFSRARALHYLVHSAGIVRGERVLTDDGVESSFAINYLSRFVLTTRLLPLLETAGAPGRTARIVLVGGAARHGTIHHEDVSLGKNFTIVKAVLQFCRANDVFTIEFARRLAAAGLHYRVAINCLKIGVVKTGIRRNFPRWLKWLVPLLLDPILGQTPEEAAEPALKLLLADEFEGTTGALFSKVRKFKSVAPDRDLLDPREGQRLWDLSERLAAVTRFYAGVASRPGTIKSA